MECPHCGSEWSIWQLDMDEEFSYPDKCPFCGCARTTFAKGSAQVLKQIIEQNGVKILQNRKALSGFIADLMNSNVKEQNSLKIVIREGVGDFFYNMIGADAQSINVQKHKAMKFITEDIGMVEERAEFVVNTFMYALGIKEAVELEYNKEKSYCDGDNAYLNLAEKYIEAGQKDIAEKLFYLSSNTGNINAMHRTITLVRKKNWIPEREDWFQWHKRLADSEIDNNESAYIVAIHFTYGLDIEENLDEAVKYWQRGRYFNSLAMSEYIVSQFIGKFPLINVNRSFSKLRELADQAEQPARAILDYIQETGSGESGWEFFFSGESMQDDVFDEDDYEQSKYQLANIMGDYYTELNRKEHQYTGLDYEELIMNWYITASISDMEEIRIDAAKKLLKSTWLVSRKNAITILESFEDYSEANFILGKEYLKGRCIDKDYKKAYQLISNSDEADTNYLLGQLYFYGWGIDADINQSIYYFERMAIGYANTHDSNQVNDEFILLKCISFLIQCYYEDLVQNNSVRSLEKLKILADYHGWKNAAKLLYWYYSDQENLYQDDIDAKHYLKMTDKNCLVPINMDVFRIIDIEDIASQCILMKYCYQYGDFFSARDAILWDNGNLSVLENGKVQYDYFGNRVYYVLAKAFAVGNGVVQNKLRAKTYIRLYIELTQKNPDEDLYQEAIDLYEQLKSESNHELPI